MKCEVITNKRNAKLNSRMSPEDILMLVQEEGYAITDGELETVAGSSWNPVYEVLPKCPVCGSIGVSSFPAPSTGCLRCVCGNCKHVWTHTPVGDL